MSGIPYSVVRFCAEECARQSSGELSVANMIDAWGYLVTPPVLPVDITLVKILGHMVEPEKNIRGFRITPVTFKSGAVALNPELIDRAIENLCSVMNEKLVGTDCFYQEFQTIHPFIDGNGRVGSLLFNFLNNTLDSPIVPSHYIVHNPISKEN